MNKLHENLACLMRCLEGYGRRGGCMTRARYERLLARQQAKVTVAAKRLAETLADVLEPKEETVTP